jgi:hypothetical protein
MGETTRKVFIACITFLLLCPRDQGLVERQALWWFVFDIAGVRRLYACFELHMEYLSISLWFCEVSNCTFIHENDHFAWPPLSRSMPHEQTAVSCDSLHSKVKSLTYCDRWVMSTIRQWEALSIH